MTIGPDSRATLGAVAPDTASYLIHAPPRDKRAREWCKLSVISLQALLKAKTL
ncbi:hypothetical protein [Desulfotomaculum copahuensis]|uniref:hypothetical protein n=1 Tax=Desulfotomaculum copahuensis TaxID=1838280 RepID=UPI000AE02A8C|nr:hypothetical protein [Desulfotomaculum copahuensis]